MVPRLTRTSRGENVIPVIAISIVSGFPLIRGGPGRCRRC
jgi:hypothetical protein